MYTLTVSAGQDFCTNVPVLGPYPSVGAAVWAAGAVRVWLHAGRMEGWLAAHPRSVVAGVLGLLWDILDAGADPRLAVVDVSEAPSGRTDQYQPSAGHQGLTGTTPAMAIGV